MRILLESSANAHTITHDIMDFFMVNKLGNGKFVDVGYLMTSAETKLTYGPRTRKYVRPEVDEKLGEYIEQYAGTPWAAKLEEIRNTPKYQKALTTGGSTPMDFGGCNIIKLGRYKINWRDQESNARDWERRDNMELDIRRKYGFGNDEDSYGESDWHRKPAYGGTGVRRVIASGKQGIAKYQGGLHDTLYTSDDGKMAIRQQLALKNGDKSVWFFVDELGKMTEMPKDVIYFLMNSFKQVKTVDGVVDLEEIEEDERNFKAELQALREKNQREIKQFLMERVLYIAGTTTRPDGEKISVAYVNDQSIYNDYPFLKKSEVNKIIAPWIKLADGELLDESFQPFGKSKRLNESVFGDEYTNPGMTRVENSSNPDDIFKILANKFYVNSSKAKKLFKYCNDYNNGLGNVWSASKRIVTNLIDNRNAWIEDEDRRYQQISAYLDKIFPGFNDVVYDIDPVRPEKNMKKLPDFICDILDGLNLNIGPYKSWYDIKNDIDIPNDTAEERDCYIECRISPDMGIIIFEGFQYRELYPAPRKLYPDPKNGKPTYKAYIAKGFQLYRPIIMFTGLVDYTQTIDENLSLRKRNKKRLNESMSLIDLPQDAMQELNGVMFTPRYAYTLERFAKSPKFGYLADFVAEHILDSDNQTIYVIDPNVKVSSRNCSDIFACTDEGLYMIFDEDNRYNEMSMSIEEDDELNVIAYQKDDSNSLLAAVYDNESGIWFTNMYTFANAFEDAFAEGDYDI
jgi:hypothetical protein